MEVSKCLKLVGNCSYLVGEVSRWRLAQFIYASCPGGGSVCWLAGYRIEGLGRRGVAYRSVVSRCVCVTGVSRGAGAYTVDG